jgi:Zn finger protein HypA/HybF involved in hydrogenase expression
VKSEPGQPGTLCSSAAAGVRFVVWCRDCRHQIEPDPAEMVERYGAETTVPEWHERLVCGKCGSREIDMVVTGTKRR